MDLRFHLNFFTQNGLYSALPTLSMMVVSLSASTVADFMIQKGIKVIHVRKIMWGIGEYS